MPTPISSRPNVQLNSESVVVKPEVAAEQMEKEAAAQVSIPTGMGDAANSTGQPAGSGIGAAGSPASAAGVSQTGSTKPPELRRFHGSATLNATRLSRDVDAIATSVVQHLAGLLDAKVKITLEIEADMPSGAPENVVRTVTENCRTLKFDNQGFEEV
jgi:uncharacterized protein